MTAQLNEVAEQLNEVETEVSLFFVIPPRHCCLLDKLYHLQNKSTQPSVSFRPEFLLKVHEVVQILTLALFRLRLGFLYTLNS